MKVNKKEREQIEPLRFTRPDNGWRPVLPPPLTDDEHIGFDFEYKSNDIPSKSKPISFSIYRPNGEGYHVPFGYEGGGNLPLADCMRWLKTELRNRHVHGLNTKAEAHMLLNLGVDIDALDIHFHDVAFGAALLNENRYSGFSLGALCEEYLPPEERKVQVDTLDPSKFYLGHAGEVADRAISDARQAYLIHCAQAPDIKAQDLQRVLDLEDRIIPATVEMERRGFLIDLPKLERWIAQVDQRLEAKTMELYDATGMRLDTKPKDLAKLFAHLNISKPSMFDEYKKFDIDSWAVEALETVKHPLVDLVISMLRLKSIKSKYLVKYRNAVDGDNILHFALHQLRSTTEFGLDADSKYGTTTGRYSCGGGEYNINAQQVMKCESQLEDFGPDFIIRELMIARPGCEMGASDASQIEFRGFAHYSNDKSLVQAYKINEREDFHMLVTKMMNPGVTDTKELKALRKHMKHNNFGVLYGMGRPKLARRLGLPCTCNKEWAQRGGSGQGWNTPGKYNEGPFFWRNEDHDARCKAIEANNIMDEYQLKFPAAKRLLEDAGKAAKKRAIAAEDGVGWVCTYLGRRRRFQLNENGTGVQKGHKALNAIIQGTAADYFKVKEWELYSNRKDLGIALCAPVHDEFVYDIDKTADKKKVQQLLDHLSWPGFKVPLLWDSGFGKNWREANGA